MVAQKPEVQLRSAGGIQYELYRKKIKQLHLRVRDNGTVMVSIPLRTSLEQADAFVRKNAPSALSVSCVLKLVTSLKSSSSK